MAAKGTKTSKFGASKRENHDSSEFYNLKIYRESFPVTAIATNVVENKIPKEKLDQMYARSSRKMSGIPDSSVHLMITSPPYNVGKEYDENLSMKSYRRLISEVLKETYRVLIPGGRICINVANIGRKPYIPLHKYIIDIALRRGFNMRGEVIWNKAAGAGSSTAWGSWKSASNPSLRDVHEYILIFSKGPYGREGSGKESTISDTEFLEFTKSVWDFMPESAKKVNHPAPFPLELPYRCIQLYSFVGDVILDPFCGVGTTCVAAKQLGRHFLGYDKNRSYVATARERISKTSGIQTKFEVLSQSDSQ